MKPKKLKPKLNKTMDLLELNKRLLVVKRDHMNNTIKYRKVVKKIISIVNIPDVLYKFILNYIGSSQFPMTIYSIRPHSARKNNSIFRHKMLQEKMNEAQ